MKRAALLSFALLLTTGLSGFAQQQMTCDSSGSNCIAVSPNTNVLRTGDTQYRGDIYLQRQNEPAIAVSTRNPNHIMIAANDYRTVDFPNDAAPGDSLTRLARSIKAGFGDIVAKLTGREPFFENKRDEAIERIDSSAPAEAWIGIYLSNDGGRSYSSYLMPGFPEDSTAVGKATPASGLQAASDPVIASAPAGRIYLGAMVFNRDAVTKEPTFSKVVVSRFTDLNNSDKGSNFHFDQMTMVDDGTVSGRKFLDKPAIAVDFDRVSSDPAACGTVWIAYTVFDTKEKDPLERSKILIAKSTDCGAHFQGSKKISHRTNLNQGVSLAIRPSDGAVFAAYRSFTDNKIYITHTDGKSDGFSPPQVVSGPNAMLTFDQPTLGTSDGPTTDLNPADRTDANAFRTNGFPTVAIDGAGKVFVAWQERMTAANTGKPAIMITSSADGGKTWATKAPVELTRSVLDANGSPTPKTSDWVGPQVMPSLSFSRGKLMLVFYEARTKDFHPVPTQGNAYFITGKYAELNVRVAQLDANGAVMGSSVFVNHYETDKDGNIVPVITANSDGTPGLRGVNRPNLPMYAGGGSPFIGDYIALVPTSPFVTVTAPTLADATTKGPKDKKNTGGPAWRFATEATDAPQAAFVAAWGDNRDVYMPQRSNPDGTLWGPPTIDGDWTKYAPPHQGAASCINPGSRNSNIYASVLSPRLFAGTPSSFKQLGIQRAFVLYVQNQTNVQKYYRLTIVDTPPTVTGSFNQFGVAQKVVDVTVFPLSTVTQNVFAMGQNQTVATQPFAVTIQEILPPLGVVPPVLPPNGDAATVVFNSDATNAASAADPLNEVHKPAIVNPDPLHQDPADPQVSNPQVSNPQVSNPQVSNPQVSNPQVSNPQVSNPQVSNPQVSNPQVSNPQVSNPQVSNVPLSDTQSQQVYTNVTNYTWEVKNAGNTVSAFQPVINIAQKAQLQGKKVVLTIYKTYNVPGFIVRDGKCILVNIPKDQIISRVENPQVSNPQVSNPQVSNPQVSNPQVSNPQVSNPQVSNPQVSNPQVSNPQVSNSTFFVAPSDFSIDPATLTVNDAKTYMTVTVQDANTDGTAAPPVVADPPGGSNPDTGVALPPPNPPLPPQTFTSGDSAVAVTATSTDVVNGTVQTVVDSATTGSDLTISTPPSFSGISGNLGDGATITIGSTSVQNTGSAPTPATGFKYGFFLSPTPDIDPTTATPLVPVVPGNFTYTGAIPTCTTSPASCTVSLAGGAFKIPTNVPAGNYFVGVRVNSGSVALNEVHIFEPENNDSATTAVVVVSDLAASQASVSPATAFPGQAVTASVTVSNLDAATPAPPSVTTFTLTNSSNTILAGPVQVATPAIAPGASLPISASLGVPNGTAPGTYTVTARVDALGGVVESNEANNSATATFSVINSSNTLTFQQGPPATVRESKPFPSAVTVRVLDQSNAVIPGVTVQLALAPVAGTGILTGTTTAVTNASGVATFSNLAVSRRPSNPDISVGGTYKLAATVTNVGAVTSAQFTVTANTVPTATNDPAGANPAAYTISHIAPLNIAQALGVLANDTDADNDPLTASVVTPPAHGTLTLNANGAFTYVPDGRFVGVDSFTYRAFDGLDYSLPATAFITLTDNAPTATNDAFSTSHGAALNGNVLSNDSDADAGDQLSALLQSQPTHATSFTLNSDGTFTYVPSPTYVGPDSFTYSATDGFSSSAPATVSITVTNASPVANTDNYAATTNSALIVGAPGVLANDTDADGDSLTASVVAVPSHGQVTLHADGSFTYQPAQGYTGPDSFTYKVNDGFVDSGAAAVNITVTAPTNAAPTATFDSANANDGAPVTIPVLANDTDPDGDTLTVTGVTAPAHGNAVVNNGTSVTYTSVVPFNGVDSFSYTISDGHGHLSTALVQVTVTHVNHTPIANDDSAVAYGGQPTPINVLANDTDPDTSSFGSIVASVSLLPPSAPANFALSPSIAFNPSTGRVQLFGVRHAGAFDPTTGQVSVGPAAAIGPNGARNLVNTNTGYVYYRSGGTIIAVDPTTNGVIATLTVGQGSIANFDIDSAHNRLYATYVLPSAGNNTPQQSGVDVFDISPAGATSHTLINSVPLTGVGGMIGLAVDSAHQTIFVSSNSTNGNGGIGKIDLSGASPVFTGISNTPAGELVYNANANVLIAGHLTGANSSSIAIINLAPQTPTVAIVALPNFVTQNTSAPGYNQHLAVHPGSGKVYVRSFDTHLNATGNLYIVDGLPSSPTFQQVTTIPMGIDSQTDDIVVATAKVIATAANSKQVAIVDVATNSVSNITLPQAANDVAVDTVGNRAFVLGGYSLFQIDLTSPGLPIPVVIGAESDLVILDASQHRAFIGQTNGAGTQVVQYNKNGVVGPVPGLAANGRFTFGGFHAATAPAHSQLYLLNSDSNTAGTNTGVPSYVAVIDQTTQQVTTFPAGSFSFGGGLNPATNIFYAGGQSTSFDRATITAIDGNAMTASTIDTSAFTENGVSFIREFVANTATNKVYFRVNNSNIGITGGVISGGVATPLPSTFGSIQIFKVNPVLNHVYVGNSNGQIFVLNGTTNQVITTLNLAGPGTAVGTQNYIAADSTTGRLFIADFNKNLLYVRDGNTSYSPLANLPTGKGPTPVAVNETTHRVYVGNALDNTLTVIDGNATPPVVLGTIHLPRPANFLAVDPVENRIYASNGSSNDVPGTMVIDDSGTTPSLTINGASGSLQGGLTTDGQIVVYSPIANASGIDTFQYTITDGQATSAAATVTVNITPALTITTAPTLPDAPLGQSYNQAISATGGQPPYAFSFVSGSLPGGLALTGSGHVQGVPDINSTTSFTVQVTDSASPQAHTATQTFTLSTGSLSILTTGLPNALPAIGTQAAQAYNFTLTAGGSSLPLTWSWTAAQGSSLPAGLSLNPQSGAITGTPQATSCSSNSFMVTVTDTANHSAQQQLTLFYSGPLTILTAALPTGVTLENYNFTPSATCGNGTRTWSITGLPLGLTSNTNGQISTVLQNFSGPRQNGTFNVNISVNDSNNVPANTTLPLTVVGVDQQPSQGSATNNPPNLASALAVPASTRIAQTFTTGASGALMGIRFQQFTQTVATISNISVGNPTTITTNAPHGLNTGDFVSINSSTTNAVNGGWTVTVLNATQFTIPANVTTAGNNGTITRNPAVLSCANNSITVTIEGVRADSGKPDDSQVYAGPFAATLAGAFTSTTILLPSPLTFATDAPFAVVWSSTGACTISAGTTNDQYFQGAAYQDNGGGWGTINGFFDVPMNTLVQNANLSYFTQTRNQTRAVAVTSSGVAKVFVLGSQNNNVTTGDMFDPSTGVVTPTGTVVAVRQDEAIVKLQNGKVLITGGSVNGNAVNSVELFDPSTAGNGSLGSFAAVAPMATQRRQHTATLLNDGRVLVVGGVNSGNSALSSAEIYDPTQNTWTTVASMVAQRNWHTATLLGDGRVLVVGGFGSGSGGNQSVEIYNPSNNTWAFGTPLQTSRARHTATTLANGKILVAGGQSTNGTNQMAQTGEIYDATVAPQVVTPAGTMVQPRSNATATLMGDGSVVFTGGERNVEFIGAPWATAERWTSGGGGAFAAAPDINTTRYDHAAVLLNSGPNSGKILVLGGFSGSGGTRQAGQSYEIYDSNPGSNGTPYITNPNLPDGQANVPYGAPGGVPASAVSLGSQVTAPTFAVVAPSTMPAGLSLAANGSVTGTPTAAGTYAVDVRVTDSNNPTHSAIQTVRIRVSALDITTSALPNGYLNKPYSFQLQATGVGTVTWSLFSGTLPNPASPAFAVNSNGTITGTPTTSGGSFTFVVKATDSLGQTAFRQLSIQLFSPLTITNTSLGDTGIFDNYNSCVFVNNGSGAKTFSVTAGTLPAGLSLSTVNNNGNYQGCISGTPTKLESQTFTIQATDQSPVQAQTDQKQFSITSFASDQEPAGDNTSHSITFGPTNNNRLAQVVRAGAEGTLGAINLWNTGCPNTTLTVQIQSVLPTTFAPSGTILGTGSGSACGAIDVSESQPGSLHFGKGDRFAIVVSSPSDVTLTNEPSTDPYSGGDAWQSVANGAWTSINAISDLQMRTLITPSVSFGYIDSIWRSHLTATRLKCPAANPSCAWSNKVLVTGGDTFASDKHAYLVDVSGATAVVTATGQMTTPRQDHTATWLLDGTVLITGGTGPGGTLATAEIYDPSTGTFTATSGNMATTRQRHTATLLLCSGGNPNCAWGGKVLIAGGNGGQFNNSVQSAELYDPTTKTFTSVAPMLGSRSQFSATFLPSSATVLVVGGISNGPFPVPNGEVYNPASDTWTATAEAIQPLRQRHQAVTLPNGKVLVFGGYRNYPQLEAIADVYDPSTNTLSPDATMQVPRADFAADSVNGSPYAFGGTVSDASAAEPVSFVEYYDTTSGTFKTAGSLATDRANMGLAVVPPAKVVVTGGWTNGGWLSSHTVETYDGSPTALSLAPTTLPGAHVNTAYPAVNLTVTGGTAPITVTKVSGSLPNGMSFGGPNCGFAQVCGTPGAGSAGTYSFSVRATDSANKSVTQAYTLSVDGLVFTTASLPNAYIGHVYTAQSPLAALAATGVGAVTFSASSGNNSIVPPGLQINGNGTITGTPSQTGFYAFDVRAVDAANQTVRARFGIQVNNPLVITTASLPDGVATNTYGGCINFNNGSGFVNASFVQGSQIPTGLAFQASGTCFDGAYPAHQLKQTGTFTFTVRLTDSSNPPQHADQQYTIQVHGQDQFPCCSNGNSPVISLPSSRQVAQVFTSSTPFSLSGVQLNNITSCSVGTMINVDVLNVTGSPALPSGPSISSGSVVVGQGGSFNNVVRLGTAIAIPQHGRYAIQLSFANGSCQGTNWPTSDQYEGGDGYVNDGQGWQSLSSITNNAVFDAGFTTLVNPTPGLTFMSSARTQQAMATLSDNTVLIIGNNDNTAEIYHPTTGTLTQLQSTISVGRSEATITPLPNGKALIIGGHVFNPGCCTSSAIANIDLYDNGTFSHVDNLTVGRYGHTATLLADGQHILVAGGWTTDQGQSGSFSTLQSAEIVDLNGHVVATLNMTGGRTRQTATLLNDGTVLVAGGWWGPPQPTHSAELFVPTDHTQTAFGSFVTLTHEMNTWRSEHTATLIRCGGDANCNFDGQVLIAGGTGQFPALATDAELYDPTSQQFHKVGAMTLGTPRHFHTATALHNGLIALIGGNDDWQNNQLSTTSVEIFYPTTTPFFQRAGDLLVDRQQHAAALINDGVTSTRYVLVAGGYSPSALAGHTVEVVDTQASGQLVIDTATLPTAATGQPYGPVTLVALGGDANYTWSLAWGQLPPGISFSAPNCGSGQFCGGANASGVYEFVVKVADGSSHTAYQQFTIVVDPLDISNTGLPTAQVNTFYTTTIVATGGSGTRTWVVDSNSALPPGLSLSVDGSHNAVISGTPTQTGNFNFALRVSDTTGHSVSRGFGLPVESTPTANNDSYQMAYGTNLTVSAPGVLANDTDPAFLQLTAQLVSGPTHGVLSFNSNGSFSYAGNNNYAGQDSFTYQVTNGYYTSAPATVTITITAPTYSSFAFTQQPADTAPNVTLAPVAVTAIGANSQPVVGAQVKIESLPAFVTTVSVGGGGGPIAIDRGRNRVYLVNSYPDFTLSVLDGATNAPVGQPIPTHVRPAGIGYDQTRDKIFIASWQDGTVQVIDGSTLQEVTSVAAGTGPFANSLDADSAFGHVYVGHDDYGQGIYVLNANAPYNQLGHWATLDNVAQVHVNHVNHRVYVLDQSGTLSAYDGSTFQLLGSVNTGFKSGFAIDETTNRIWIGSGDFGPEQLVAVVDGNTMSLLATPSAPKGTQAPQLDSTRRRVYFVSFWDPGYLAVYDADSFEEIYNTPLGSVAPRGLGYNPDTHRIYIGHQWDGLAQVFTDAPVQGTTTASTNGSGVATFSGLFMTDAGNGYTLLGRIGPARTGLSNPFVINPTSHSMHAFDDSFTTPMNTTLVGGELPSIPVSWWRADFTGSDSAGVNNAQLSNIGFTGARSYQYGAAFSFDGATSSVRIPASPSLNIGANGSFTIQGWINPTDLNDAHPVFEWNNGTSFGVHVWHSFFGAGNLYVNVFDTNGIGHVSNALGVLQAGVWQHVAITYDAATGMERSYVNGVEVSNAQLGSFTPQTSYDLYLGYRPSGGPYGPFAGAIDDVAVANRALTASDIWSDYNCACIGVIANDTDADNDPLTAVLVSGPSHGTLTLQPSGNFTYLPTGGFTGNDSFTYRANDGYFNSNVATVTITVTGGSFDAPPAAFSSSVYTPVSTAVPVGAYPATPANRWPADGNLNDVVGGFNGISANMTYSAGRAGQAFTFDGTGAATVDVGTAFYSTTAVTFGGWVYAENVQDAWGGAGFIFGDGRDVSASGNGGVGLHLTNHNGPQSPRAYFFRGTNDQVDILGVPMTTNAWHHIAFTFDGTSLRLYQDGVQTASTTFAATTIQTPFCALKIGVDNFCGFGDVYPFHGLIDDLSIFNRALTATEILQWSRQITAGDLDTSSASLQYVITANPQHGQLSGSLPNVTYTPNNGFNGVDSFTYYVTDGIRQSAPVTVTITVGPQTLNVPADYGTIQTAIDAAHSGDTVMVDSGHYYENLTWANKALIITSVNGSGSTIIDGQQSGSVLSVSNVPFGSVSGFTFINGFATTHAFNDNRVWGGGILLQNSPIAITDSVIGQNSAGWTCNVNTLVGCGGGGGIAIINSNALIDHVQVQANTAANEGGGIEVQSSNATIRNSTLNGNSPNGLFAFSNGANVGPTLINTLVTNNTDAQVGGAGVGVWQAALTLINDTITKNSPGGYIEIDPATDHVKIENTIISGNDLAEGSSWDVTGYSGGNTVNTNAAMTNSIIGVFSNFTPSATTTTADPQFVDTVQNNFHLKSTSPGINNGSNLALPPGVTLDLDDNPRIAGGVVDIGAYEDQNANDGPMHHAPISTSASYQTPVNTAVTFALSGVSPDSNALSFRVATLPGFGSLSGDPSSLIYTPNQDFVGADTFQFYAYDAYQQSATSGIITIYVGEQTASLNDQRFAHTATLLNDGRVLIAGGYNSQALASAETYDSSIGAWSATGSMHEARDNGRAVLLLDGRVLVVGGCGDSDCTNGAEIYDPAGGTWTAVASMAHKRSLPVATLLADGRVLVAGGADNVTYHNTAEIYDPVANTWTTVASMGTPRYAAGGITLVDGRVLVAGGNSSPGGPVATAEVYDPVANSWSATLTNLSQARAFFPVVALVNGSVVAAGGLNGATATNVVDSYNPDTNTWTQVATMNHSRYDHTATVTGDGRVLVTGGSDGNNILATTELMDAGGQSWTFGPALQANRFDHTATRLKDNRVLMVGGLSAGEATSERWAYDQGGCIDITSLPANLTQPGTYCVQNNLTGSIGGGSAVTISSNNVTLDLGGYTISNTFGASNTANGILANGYKRITVRNGTVTGFYTGITVDYGGTDSASNLVEDVTVSNSLVQGIEVQGDYSRIRNNVITNVGGSTVSPTEAVAIVLGGNYTSATGNSVTNVFATGGSVPGVDWALGIDSGARTAGTPLRIVGNSLVNIHGSTTNPFGNTGISCNTANIGIQKNSVNVSSAPGRAWNSSGGAACQDLGGNTYTGQPPQ